MGNDLHFRLKVELFRDLWALLREMLCGSLCTLLSIRLNVFMIFPKWYLIDIYLDWNKYAINTVTNNALALIVFNNKETLDLIIRPSSLCTFYVKWAYSLCICYGFLSYKSRPVSPVGASRLEWERVLSAAANHSSAMGNWLNSRWPRQLNDVDFLYSFVSRSGVLWSNLPNNARGCLQGFCCICVYLLLSKKGCCWSWLTINICQMLVKALSYAGSDYFLDYFYYKACILQSYTYKQP